MRIIVNHLTRMSSGHICVAGVTDAGRHIRPVLAGRLPATLLRRNGGPFDIGAVVDLGPVTARPSAPEVEDMLFVPENATLIEVLSWQQLWTRLAPLAGPNLPALFGPLLARRARGYAYPAGQGVASLGILYPQPQSRLEEAYGKARLSLRDGDEDLNLSVTDFRLVEEDLKTLRWARFIELQAKMAAGVPVLLSVGVGRPWGPDGELRGHWLQVNNIFFNDGSDAVL